MAAVPTIGRASGVERRPTAPEADATRALYERYSRQILNYCVHQLNSREEAEDAVQTTFMNAFRGLKRGVVPEAEQAWLFKIAENVCLSRRRSSWRRGKVESPNDFEVLQEIVPSKHGNRADELIGLEEALEAMPENQRRAILLREWQGLSYREIADELDLSQAAVETLIFRARRSLANGLESPAPPKRRRRIGVATDGVSLGSLITGLKSVLTGGAAVKAVVVAVAAGSATVAATRAEPSLLHHRASTAATVVHVTKQSQATFSPQASIVAGASGMTVSQANARTHRGVSLHDAVAAPTGTRSGHGRLAQAPAEDATHTQAPPMIPAAPSAPVPAPEAPIAAAPAPTPPAAAQPRTESPKSEPSSPGKTGNGNEGKDNNSNGGPKSETPKAADAPKAEPAKSDAPKADPPNGKDDGKGNDNKNDEKKADAPRQVSAPAAAASAPLAPATPAPPVQLAANNGNGNDKGSDKKQDAPAPAPASPAAAATPAPAAPTTTAAAPTAVPPVPSTNSPMHGNGNGAGDHSDNKDKGKGK